MAPLTRTSSERRRRLVLAGGSDCSDGLEQIHSTSRRARRGAARQAEMAEDLVDHRRVFDSRDDLQSAAAVGAMLHVKGKDPFQESRPARARRRALRVASWLEGSAARSSGAGTI